MKRKLYLIGEGHLLKNRIMENEFIKFLVKRTKSKPIIMLEGLPFKRYYEGKSNIDIFLLKGLKIAEVWGIDSSFLLQIATAYKDMISVIKLLTKLYVKAINEKDKRKKLSYLINFLVLIKFEQLKMSSNSPVLSSIYNLITNVENGNLNLKPQRIKSFKKFLNILNSNRIDECLNYLKSMKVRVDIEEINILSDLILRIKKVEDIPSNLDEKLLEINVIRIFDELISLVLDLKKDNKLLSFNDFMVKKVTRDFRNRIFVKNIKKIMSFRKFGLNIVIVGMRHIPFIFEKLDKWADNNDVILKVAFFE